jgi:hypothetical protein
MSKRASSAYQVPPNTTRVHFDTPILLELIPNQKGKMETLTKYGAEQIAAAVAHCKANGYDERAIVAPKTDQWKARSTLYYGVVTGLSSFQAYEEAYKPISVKWCSKSDPDSKHWPHELWLIHPAISIQDLDKLIAEQKVPSA